MQSRSNRYRPEADCDAGEDAPGDESGRRRILRPVEDDGRGDGSSVAGRTSSVGRWTRRLLPDGVVGAAGALSALPALAASADPGDETSDAQAFDWERRFDGNVDVRDAAAVDDGGYVLAGAAGRNPDVWLAKAGPDGTVEWTSRASRGDGIDVARSVVPVAGGGYVFAGTSSSTGADDGDCDVLLVRTDRRGNPRWQRAFGGTAFDFCSSVVRTPDGGYAIAGSTQSFAADGQDMWLLEVDGDGRTAWDRTYDRSRGDVLRDVVPTDDGGYALVGSTFGDGTDCWVARTDGEGHVTWERTLSRGDADVGRSIVRTGDGGVAVAGYTTADGDRKEAWLAKLDVVGGVEWQRTYGRGSDDRAVDLVRTDDGGYALAGTTTAAGRERALLVKTDAEGRRERLRALPGSDSLRTVLPGATAGTYVLAGAATDAAARDAVGWLARYSPSADERVRP